MAAADATSPPELPAGDPLLGERASLRPSNVLGRSAYAESISKFGSTSRISTSPEADGLLGMTALPRAESDNKINFADF